MAAAISDEDDAVAAEHEGRFEETDRAGNPFQLRLVRLDRADYDRYYNVFANPLLWFIQHGLWNRPYAPEMSAATRAAWESYRRVNEAFAAAVADECGDADAVLVHDYQLYLVPRMLRSAGVRAPLSHFTHIPWPGPDAWRVLTADMRTGLLEGLLGADVIGFHTNRSVRAFLATAEEYVGEAFVDHVRPRVTLREAVTHVRAYPISVDPDEFRALAARGRRRRGRGPAGGRPARAAGAARRPDRPVQERRPRLPCLRPVPRPPPRVARPGEDARATGSVQAGDTRLCGVRWSDPPCGARGE